MINIKKMLENIQHMQVSNPLFEYSYAEIASKTDPARQSKGRLPSFYSGLDQSADGQARTKWKVQSQSQNGLKYDAVVEIHIPTTGGLFAWAKGKWEPKKFKEILTKSDVKVHCNCKDFAYRMQYQAGPNGVHKGLLAPDQKSMVDESKIMATPPVHTNPNGDLIICKHLYSIFRVFPTNASSIISDARKYNNTVKVNTDTTNKTDAGVKVAKPEVKTPLLNQQKDMAKEDLGTINEGDATPMLNSLYTAMEEINNKPEPVSEPIINEQPEVEKSNEEKPTENVGLLDMINEPEDVTEPVVDETEITPQPEEVDVGNKITEPINDAGILDKMKDDADKENKLKPITQNL